MKLTIRYRRSLSQFKIHLFSSGLICALCFAIAVVFIFTLYLLTEAFHLITFLLALQRFLIYFFPPGAEKYVTAVQDFINKQIWKLYLVMFLKEVVLIIVYSLTEFNKEEGLTHFGIYFIVSYGKHDS